MFIFTGQKRTSTLPCLVAIKKQKKKEAEQTLWQKVMVIQLFYIFQPPFLFATFKNVLIGLLPILTFM